jgi:hypothetical protein
MKRVPVLIPVLVFVACLFLGLLVFTYVEAKRANPQMIRTSRAGWQPAGGLAIPACPGSRPAPIDNRRAGCQPAPHAV